MGMKMKFMHMKRLTAVLAAVMILFTSTALAQDLSTLTDDELLALWIDVGNEMVNRGMIGVQQADEPEDPDKRDLLGRMNDFFSLWSQNRQSDMQEYCASDWKASVENPKTALFGLLANRTPMSLETVNISGGPGDTVRTVTVHTYMDRNNGKPARQYRYEILMKKEDDGQWYIDPRCLDNSEPLETETPAPELTAVPEGDDPVLYYVPESGMYYHTDPNCKRVNEKYLPMKGMFRYSELNDEPFRNMEPCVICGAPPRQK
jgi:hypothetical protein